MDVVVVVDGVGRSAGDDGRLLTGDGLNGDVAAAEAQPGATGLPLAGTAIGTLLLRDAVNALAWDGDDDDGRAFSSSRWMSLRLAVPAAGDAGLPHTLLGGVDGGVAM